MKKIIKHILFLLFISICGFQSTSAHFMTHDHETQNHIQKHDVKMHHHQDQHHAKHGCEAETHDCCKSPFIDANAPLSHLFLDDTPNKDYSDFLLLSEIFTEKISLEKLTAPPNLSRYWTNLFLSWSYIDLIGIIRSNA